MLFQNLENFFLEVTRDKILDNFSCDSFWKSFAS